MALPRKAIAGTVSESVDVNVYDVATKKIVFTGSQRKAAQFMEMSREGNICYYLKTKAKYKNKYAVRYASENIK